jgi:hypothetical protein
MRVRIGDTIFYLCETGEWLQCGRVKVGIDGEYVEWFA